MPRRRQATSRCAARRYAPGFPCRPHRAASRAIASATTSWRAAASGSTCCQSRAALRGACNTPLPDAGLTHDAVDALCAAFTAWTWRHGLGCALGRPDEGLIVLPVPAGTLKERYGAL